MKTIDLTTGPVQRVIVSLALPLVGSSLLQFTYSLVDMFWVGALGSDAVASIGAASFYIMLGQAIQSLIVVGAGIKVSQAVGQMIGNGYFSGLGLPKIPATISIVFTVARIPLALALEPYLGLDAIWWSIALSSIVKGLVSALYVRLTKKEVTSLAEAI